MAEHPRRGESSMQMLVTEIITGTAARKLPATLIVQWDILYEVISKAGCRCLPAPSQSRSTHITVLYTAVTKHSVVPLSPPNTQAAMYIAINVPSA